MALLELSMVTAAIIEMGVDAAAKKLGRRETVVKVLRRLDREAEPDRSDFDAIYVRALVEYGVFKPAPVLNFFRNEFVRAAFRQSFYQNDPSILYKEAEEIIQWNEETGKLGRIDYDPRREFAAFTAAFNDVVDRTRTPAEVKRDQKLDELLAKVDSLPLDDIRAELARIQQTYQARQFVFAPSGDKLKVFISSKMAELRDLRELLHQGLEERGLDAWVYEKSGGARPGDVVETSLREVEAADVYVGLFWLKYGSVTAQEYLHARSLGKPCFIYIRDYGAEREKELEDFLRSEVYDLKRGITYAYFDDALPLVRQAADDILAWLVRQHRELTAEIRAARISEYEITKLKSEVDRLQALSRAALPQGTPLDYLAQQLRGWFTALDYKFESQEVQDEHHFEWLINVPARRGYDRILVHGVSGEAGRPAVQTLRQAADEHNVDEGWLIAARRVSSAAASEVKKPENQDLFCYTLDQLIDEQIDFSNYTRWLEAEIRRQHVDTMYIPLAATKDEFDPITKEPVDKAHYDGTNGWLEGYIDRWLDDPSKEHVSILGEFGTGKTWFCLRYAWDKVKAYIEARERGTERPRFPLVIPLRDYAKAFDVENVIARFFFDRHNIRMTGAVFDQLNRMGRLLLIFDGFDEMAARVDRQQMVNNFWQLARVVVPGAKAILTCRTEHFPTAMEACALLSAELVASTSRLTGEPPQFEVLELDKLTDEQIRKVLSFRTGAATVTKVMRNPQLLDLLHRPVMADLVLEALPEVESGKPIDLPRVYLYAVTRKMERDIKSERTFTSLADKLYFMCEVSWEMISTDRLTLNYRDFPERVRLLFPHAVREQKDLDHWQYDMMAQTLLIRNATGDYTPAHRSLAEFFAAYKLAAELGALPSDFLAIAQAQSNIDVTEPPQPYTWSSYFARELDKRGARAMIAPLQHFIPEPARAIDPSILAPVLPRSCRAVGDLLAHLISDEWIAGLPSYEVSSRRSEAYRKALAVLSSSCACDPFDLPALVGAYFSGARVVDGIAASTHTEESANKWLLLTQWRRTDSRFRDLCRFCPEALHMLQNLKSPSPDHGDREHSRTAPIVIDGETVAALTLTSLHLNPFSDREVPEVRELAVPLAIILCNIGWFREAWQQHREQWGYLLVQSLTYPVVDYPGPVPLPIDAAAKQA